jgi:hypothetical protein
MVFGRRGFRVERIVILLSGGLTVLDYFDMRFYIAGRFIIFRFFLSLGYNGVVSSSYRDLLRQAIT